MTPPVWVSVSGECAATRMDLPGMHGMADYPPCKLDKCKLAAWVRSPAYQAALRTLELTSHG